MIDDARVRDIESTGVDEIIQEKYTKGTDWREVGR